MYVAVGLGVGLFFALLAGFYLVYQLRKVVLALFVWCLGSLLAVNDFAKAAGRLLKPQGRCWELVCHAAVRR